MSSNGTDREVENAVTLLPKTQSQLESLKPKKLAFYKRRRKLCLFCGCVALFIVVILVALILLLLFSKHTLSLRVHLSETLGIQLPDYQKPEMLDTTAGAPTKPYDLPCGDVTCASNATSEDNIRIAAYLNEAELSWNRAWEVLTDTTGWQLDTGSSLESGKVQFKSYKVFGRVTKLQAMVDCSPRELFDITVRDADVTPEWYSDLAKSEVVERVTPNIEVSYVLMKPIAGGIISSRDYVNLLHWKERDGILLASTATTTHPDRPEVKGAIRANNKIGGIIFRPVAGNSNRCFMEWAICTDIGGWVPTWTVNQGIARTLLSYLQQLKSRVKYLNEQKTKSTYR